MITSFKNNDIVKSCPLLERGIRFWNKGIVCCSAVTKSSPVLVSAEEMRSGHVTYDVIVSRRKKLFEAFNGLNDMPLEGCSNCALVTEKKYKDVDLTRLGGLGGECLASSFNISHFSMCNLRCTYCLYTIENDFTPPQYDNIIEIIDEFRKKDKLDRPNNIDYNGGEPTLLNNFSQILNYLVGNDIGYVTVYSNCLKYSQPLCDALKTKKVGLITSLDAGTPTSYCKIHGADAFYKAINTIIRYKKSGTSNLVVKYNICATNISNDDLYGFVFLMAAIQPPHVFLCPEFPYGDMEIPFETVEFGAHLYLLLEKYAGITPHIQTDDMKGDPKLMAYSTDIRICIEKMRQKFRDEIDYTLTTCASEPCKCTSLSNTAIKMAEATDRFKNKVKSMSPTLFTACKKICQKLGIL